MMISSKIKSLFLSGAAFVLLLLFSSWSAAALSPLDEEAMSDISGQALLDIDKYDYMGNNFYKIIMNSNVTTSLNMENLTLRDGSGNKQIDIDNLSINGGDSSNGNAAVSSARIENPFVEFAFDGSIAADNANNRKIVGVRFGAESITGFMSFGNQADESGINLFNGYMKTTKLEGAVKTFDSAGGYETVLANVTSGRCCFNVNGNVVIQDEVCFFGCTTITWATGSISMPNTTMTFPSVELGTLAAPVTFLASGLEINTAGSGPISQISVLTDLLNLPNVPFKAEGNGAANLGITVNMDTTSTGVLSGLTAKTQFTEELRYMHKAELQGNGMYVSAQNRAIKWLGSPANDTAQAGWWMSISKELDFGAFDINNVTLPNSSLSEIAAATSTYLQANPIVLTLGDAIGGALSGSTSVALGSLPLGGSPPINIPLTNVSLGSTQVEIRNCWNGVLGC